MEIEKRVPKSQHSQPARDDFLRDVISQFVERRVELGLTQEEVDTRMGNSERLVSKWECGLNTPSPFNFFCWADALKTHLTITPYTHETIEPK